MNDKTIIPARRYQKFLDQSVHNVGAVSDDQRRIEIITRRSYGLPPMFNSRIDLVFKSTDAVQPVFKVGDKVLLEDLNTETFAITIKPKNNRILSIKGVFVFD